MKLFFITIICLAKFSFVLGQSNLEIVVNMALNYPDLYAHIEKQNVINKEAIKYVLYNKVVDSTLDIVYHNDSLKFNDPSTVKGFGILSSFIINEVEIKKKKAIVEYMFIPEWYDCSNGNDFYMPYYSGLFIKITVELKKKKGIWFYKTCEMEDINFALTDTKADIECLKKRYIKIK